MAVWSFSCADNGGKRQSFSVNAKNKTEAIEKAFQKAKKNAKGDIYPSWTCKLVKA